MISGLVIPGDTVEEEEDEASTEGASSDSYRTPAPVVTPPPSGEKVIKRRKTREPFYKGYGLVYLPGDIKGLTEFLAGNTTVGTNWFTCWMHC